MQFWKLGRLANLIVSIIYNLVFLALASDLFWVLILGDHTNYQMGQLLEAMFLSYNIIIHTPIFLENCFIILKEGMLEFIQVSERRDGHDSNVALGLTDVFDVILGILNLLNPRNVLIFILHNF